MKKFAIVLGIAFALIVGVIFGSMMSSNVTVESDPEPVSIEEAATDYLENKIHHGTVDIDNLKVMDIDKDEDYGGGYRVIVLYDRNGDPGWTTDIAISSLGDFEF